MPVEKVMEILEEGRGKQFDPEVLDIFRNLMEQERTAKAEESLARIS
jgi:HD-GYP domain-containing protein (c-di-GMP phosphodiesterase class II)